MICEIDDLECRETLINIYCKEEPCFNKECFDECKARIAQRWDTELVLNPLEFEKFVLESAGKPGFMAPQKSIVLNFHHSNLLLQTYFKFEMEYLKVIKKLRPLKTMVCH
ncbi:unnamed protein product [Cylicocyclus nassatus]|uniref:Uncharacterized protein n=1 Tax=Cylicocyclus nassatus TaxID=53992 RepID=A0AA36DSP9_CYLNA|nr:unnamed protein product [Cylicocyclus nassatus]